MAESAKNPAFTFVAMAAQRAWRTMRQFKADSLLAFAESSAALLISGALIGAVIRMSFWHHPHPLEWTLRLVDQNWRGSAILGLVLVFRPIRKFLEEVESAFGMQRRRSHLAIREEELVVPKRDT